MVKITLPSPPKLALKVYPPALAMLPLVTVYIWWQVWLHHAVVKMVTHIDHVTKKALSNNFEGEKIFQDYLLVL